MPTAESDIHGDSARFERCCFISGIIILVIVFALERIYGWGEGLMAALGVLFALINVRSYRLLLLWSLDGALRRRALILVLIKLPVLLLLIFLFTRLSPAALFSVLAGFFCFVPAAILFLLGTRRKEER